MTMSPLERLLNRVGKRVFIDHYSDFQSCTLSAGEVVALLPQEFTYLKENLGEAIALHDPETMGEFLDTLKSFGLNGSDEVIRTGITYLLDTQRADGTWSDPKEKDPYTLYHSAWTAIDGLKDCRWQGEGLSFPQVRPLLDSMRQPLQK